MGYQAYSHVIYGISVNKKYLEKKERARSCTHNANESAKFCPECGKPIWTEKINSVLKGLSHDDYDENGELCYFTEYGGARDEPDYDFMIGFQLAQTGYGNKSSENKNRAIVKMPTEKMKQEILGFIKKNKLKLTEEDIQMIAYTYHSY
jgi:hypothetical protein